ncbi:MAG: beta-galactosidase [Tannerellaceae bacterium]|jgi:hypothetical protein|nr:beta-galactosidase [Tannerellaceae bacterium]
MALVPFLSNCEESKWKSDGQLPILAWFSIPESETSLSRYRELKDAGFTHNLMYFSNTDEMERAMDTAQVAGVKMLVWCPELRSDPEGTVRRFKNHPALAGYHLQDEPLYSEFPRLSQLARRIQALDNEHFCYVNLWPGDTFTPYSEHSLFGHSSYREYVKACIEQVPLPFISFDNYPIWTPDSTGIHAIGKGWYSNLSVIYEECKKAGKPFWAFARTAGAGDPVGGTPSPTLEELRLEVYTALAYGAQGIQYYVYEDNTNPSFHDMPFDYFKQQKTPTYYMVQELNKEIRNFAKVFLGATALEVKHTGAPYDKYRLEQAPNVFKTFETGETGATTSLLEKGDRTFFVILNRDVNERLDVKVEVDASVRQVTKNGTLKTVTGLRTESLKPGDVLIYTWPKQ